MSISPNMNSATAIWQRAIAPGRGTFAAAAARALLDLHVSARDLDRADALAAKAAAGRLTPGEVRELEAYRSVGTALEFLKSKARRSLRKPAAGR